MSIGLGNIPIYLNTSGTLAAIQTFQSIQISATGSSVLPDYTTIKSDASLQELVNAGFNTAELQLSNYTPLELYNYGFTLQELKEGNYTAYELYTYLSVPIEELDNLGYSSNDISNIITIIAPDNTQYEKIDLNSNIYKYCNTNSKLNGTNIRSSHCVKSLPLSKTNSGLNTSTNNTATSCRMAYAARIKTYGITNPSGSYPKKTCSIGGPTFSY